MKAMDRLGNQLRQGDVLYFSPLQSLVTVLEVEEPGKISDSPGCLLLGIKIPFKLENGKTDALFAEMIKVHTPDEGRDAEKQVNDILTRNAPKRPLQMGKAG